MSEKNKPTQPPTDSASDSASTPHDPNLLPSTSFMKNMLQSLQYSSNCLIFIQYTPTVTMRLRWFLVQLEDGNYATEPKNNLYYCTFLNGHPSATVKVDNKVRWCPEWREISWNKDRSFEYGRRVLLSPKAKSDEEKFRKFGNLISLQENDTVLVGPFDFSTPIYLENSSAKVDIKFWNFLSKICGKFSILPPVLSQSEKSSIVCASRFRVTLPSVSEQSLCASSSTLFTHLCCFLKGRESHTVIYRK